MRRRQHARSTLLINRIAYLARATRPSLKVSLRCNRHQQVRQDTPSDTPTNMPLGSVSRIQSDFANICWLYLASSTIRRHRAHAASGPGTGSRSAFIPHPHFTHTHPLRVSVNDTERGIRWRPQQRRAAPRQGAAVPAPTISVDQRPTASFLPTIPRHHSCLANAAMLACCSMYLCLEPRRYVSPVRWWRANERTVGA